MWLARVHNINVREARQSPFETSCEPSGTYIPDDVHSKCAKVDDPSATEFEKRGQTHWTQSEATDKSRQAYCSHLLGDMKVLLGLFISGCVERRGVRYTQGAARNNDNNQPLVQIRPMLSIVRVGAFIEEDLEFLVGAPKNIYFVLLLLLLLIVVGIGRVVIICVASTELDGTRR